MLSIFLIHIASLMSLINQLGVLPVYHMNLTANIICDCRFVADTGCPGLFRKSVQMKASDVKPKCRWTVCRFGCIRVISKAVAYSLKKLVPSWSSSRCGRPCSWTINTPSTVRLIPHFANSSRMRKNRFCTDESFSKIASFVPNV